MGKAGWRVRESGRRARPPRSAPTAPAGAETNRPESRWSLVETIWAAGVGVVALALYLSTFSSSVALGDAPESVSGIRSVGILHAPGYPTYVLLGRLWATVLPFGSWALRVNLFSVACATATVVLVFVLARLFGAGRFPAAIGALTVATSVSFWFNAGYAKHYALSGLIVTAAAVLVVSWERKGGTARLVTAGAVLGLGVGASWELIASVGVGLLAFVALSERRPSRPEIVGALAAGVVFAAGLLGFVVVRAGQNPPINWGDATTLSRLTDLVRQKDFLGGTTSTPGGGVAQSPARAVTYMHITVQELGVAAIALAIVGAVYVYRRHRRNDAVFLGIVLLTNLVGAIFAGSASTGVHHDTGILSAMVVGGFLIGVVLVVGVLVAVGITSGSETLETWIGTRSDTTRAATATIRTGIVAVAAAAILIPSLVVHEPYASHRGPAYADDYARRVLDALPQNAVLLTDGWEFGQPVRYLQIVHGERRDVSILSDPEAQTAWYRDELRRELPTIAPASNVPYTAYVQQFVANARAAHRRVFVDMSTIGLFNGAALQLDGMVAELTSGSGITLPQPIAAASSALHDAQLHDGWLRNVDHRFAERSVSLFEVRADVALAKVGAINGEIDTARTQLRDAVTILPDIASNRAALQLVDANDPGARAAVLALTGGES